ncbi:Rv3235 family protein [Tessaracoccus massiliensis]|uniref:Rv3235 family protein n=1 Tax=Tessaracoccus massiliensis TaxID=1522311 RepID=UPI00058F7634|nr:Rv3235 family protein [Tessaracoccus massiliensis]
MSFPSITRIHPDSHPHGAPPQALRLIHVLLEAVAGRRALHQVRPLLAAAPFTRLADYADAGTFRRMAIGPVRAQMPTSRAVEATVSLLCGGRIVSCAIRLDVHHGRWRCTELTVLQPAALLAAA